MIWLILIILVLLCLAGIRRVPPGMIGVFVRLNERTKRTAKPGKSWVLPGIERLDLVDVQPFSVSLPPQSAITKDEIPIQLQASLDAVPRNPELAAVSVRDWRIFLTSQLQNLMKDRLEELDFDRLDEAFPSWVQSIREDLERKAGEIGVDIRKLQISNLSPRTKPA